MKILLKSVNIQQTAAITKLLQQFFFCFLFIGKLTLFQNKEYKPHKDNPRPWKNNHRVVSIDP